MTTPKEITEEMFLKGEVKIKEPEILSKKDENYYKSYSSHLTMSDIESLCKVLQYPSEKIFTDKNLEAINHYGSLELNGKEFQVGSHRIGDILLEIRNGKWVKNEVLHDTSKLLGKHKKDELELKVRVYNYLIKESYITIES